MSWTIHHGDCRDVMAKLDAESFDAIICDPPYGLEFMGKEWDSFRGEAWRSGAGMSKPGIGDRPTAWPSFGGGDSANATCASCGGRMRGKKKCRCEHPDWRVKGKPLGQRNARAESMQSFGTWCEAWAAEALRVAKPGAHLLAFGGTRTYHRLACAIEDAGWEIRDCVMWVYGSGFPKSHDVSKAIDKAAGAERPRVDGPRSGGMLAVNSHNAGHGYRPNDYGENGNSLISGDPITDAARQWSGWGTALKPAWEPIIVARKPLCGTVAENVLRHGTGAINVDGCRVGTESVTINTWNDGAKPFGGGAGHEYTGRTVVGRWPANVIHDGSDEVVGLFPNTHSRGNVGDSIGNSGTGFVGGVNRSGGEFTRGDSGSAARFFYCAKASKADRDEGLDGFVQRDQDKQGHKTKQCNICGCNFRDPKTGNPSCGHDDFHWTQPGPRRNHHPTVKPTSLMRYLCRLVTPPGGVVLDPFTGSGSTGKAAVLEGFDFVGIERESEYVEIAKARIAAAGSGSGPLFA